MLVLHDMLGVTRGKLPRFVRDFLSEGGGAEAAVRRYVQAVKDDSQMQSLSPSSQINASTMPRELDDLDPFTRVGKNRDA